MLSLILPSSPLLLSLKSGPASSVTPPHLPSPSSHPKEPQKSRKPSIKKSNSTHPNHPPSYHVHANLDITHFSPYFPPSSTSSQTLITLNSVLTASHASSRRTKPRKSRNHLKTPQIKEHSSNLPASHRSLVAGPQVSTANSPYRPLSPTEAN